MIKRTALLSTKLRNCLRFGAPQTEESELEGLVREAADAIDKANVLLMGAIAALPDYTDGRNDALCDCIIDWIDEQIDEGA